MMSVPRLLTDRRQITRYLGALDVPETWHPVLTTTLGWPADVEQSPRDRRPVDEILTIIG